jgi:hypothetical protein
MVSWRPSEDTKIIKILVGPNFLEPGKAGLGTDDEVFVEMGTLNMETGRSRRRVKV